MAGPSAMQLRKANKYSLYVLLLLLLSYLFNQLDRYILAIISIPIAQDLHYGDKGCLPNKTVASSSLDTCKNYTEENSCDHATVVDKNRTISHACEWNYDGQGLEYQILAGPVFILIYTLMGIGVSVAADRYNRVTLLAASLALWSACTALSGLTTQYWQLLLARFGLGLGEAGCTPFAASLISQYFAQELRASALGVYNWGIYIGYSLSYAIGNGIFTLLGWRWVFGVCGIAGAPLAILIFLTMKEPSREVSPRQLAVQDGGTRRTRLLSIVKQFFRPSVCVLLLAGSIRNAGGYVWAYNTQPYYQASGQTPEEISAYMSWIPLIGGSVGVVVGGFISDLLITGRGPYARVWVLVASQIVAAPFAAGALFLSPPYAYISLIPANIIGEMWVGVTLAIVTELFPVELRTSAVAVYLFVISNIGGNAPLLVPLFQQAFQNQAGYDKVESLRASLYILYPGMYVLSVIPFLLSASAIRADPPDNSAYDKLSEDKDDEEDEDVKEKDIQRTDAAVDT